MNETARLAQAAAIDCANNALMDAGLPSYDDLVGALRDARALLAHANAPATRSVQRIDTMVARVDAVAESAPGAGTCDSCGHDLDDVNFGCRDCL